MVTRIFILIVFLQVFSKCKSFLMCNNTIEQKEGMCKHILNCGHLYNKYIMRNKSDEFFNDHRTTCQGAMQVCCPQKFIVVDTKPRTTTPTTPKPPPTYKLPTPPFCGVGKTFNTRIVNGIDARIGEFPWIVALGYHDDENPGKTKFICGATLITNRHVVTAAHCVIDSLYMARLGVVNLLDEGVHTVDVDIERKNKHENYTYYQDIHDIAVLYLNRTVEGPNIRPICLPIGETNSFVNYYPLVAGWGRIRHKGPLSTAQLKMAMIPIISNEECKEKLSVLEFKAEQIIDGTLCAAYKTGDTDSCEGDSGGPMMWGKMDMGQVTFYLIGIVSWGQRCADPRYPGVYTRVTHYLHWIQRQLY